MNLTYIGNWEFPNKKVRLFNLRLPDGRIPTFCVAPGQDLKSRLTEIQQKFAKEKAT